MKFTSIINLLTKIVKEGLFHIWMLEYSIDRECIPNLNHVMVIRKIYNIYKR